MTIRYQTILGALYGLWKTEDHNQNTLLSRNPRQWSLKQLSLKQSSTNFHQTDLESPVIYKLSQPNASHSSYSTRQPTPTNCLFTWPVVQFMNHGSYSTIYTPSQYIMVFLDLSQVVQRSALEISSKYFSKLSQLFLKFLIVAVLINQSTHCHSVYEQWQPLEGLPAYSGCSKV